MIVKKDSEIIQNYLTDASNYKTKSCDAVYIPENYDELIELVKTANEKKIPLTISGAGTGLVGGRVPVGGIVISLERFNQILAFNKDEKSIRVQAFVTLSELQNFLKEHKLFYPPDPTEKNCSIGGTIATNASGARTLKYGPTRNWINAIKVVLPDGEIFDLPRGKIFADGLRFNFKTNSGKNYSFELPNFRMPNVKNAAGYFIKPNMDLIDLFIGSEGTLGVILEAELKLLDEPDELISMVIFFEAFDDAYNFVSISREENKSDEFKLINPRALEFFDDKALEFLSSKFPNVQNKKFAVWFEQEIYKSIHSVIPAKAGIDLSSQDVIPAQAGNQSSTNDVIPAKAGIHSSPQDVIPAKAGIHNPSETNINPEELLEQLSNLIQKCNGNLDEIWFAFNEKEINDIKEFRHSISALVNEYISRNNLRKVGTDIAVPSKSFKEFYFHCRNECEKNSINYVGYGHIGNNHLHFNMLPADQVQNELAVKLYRDFCEKAIEMGGTISAEHGIGKLKRPYFELMYPENVLKGMFNIKKTFDPELIVNRNNIFPERFYND